MAKVRKPFQGVSNIIRFNWHFFVVALVLIILLFLIGSYLESLYQILCFTATAGALLTTLVSLLVSYYVYDLSNLYRLDWLDNGDFPDGLNMVNIHAGFDEMSDILIHKYPNANLNIFDFYDPQRHTEVSIRRARKAYPPHPNTQIVNADSLPLENDTVDKVFVLLSAHEIRSEAERHLFFMELKRVLRPGGQIIITEHLRDLANFLVYNIGAFHFFPKSVWLQNFKKAGLQVGAEIKITPFISSFILEHGNPS